MEEHHDLPGAELIDEGLRDLACGVESAAALLVGIGAPRLRRLGVPVLPDSRLPADPELRLYRLLCREEGKGAYSRYNSLVRRLISFEQGLERRVGRRATPWPRRIDDTPSP